jgi:hypothetical protein
MAWSKRTTALAVDIMAKVVRRVVRYSAWRPVSLVRTVKARTAVWAVLRTDRPRSCSEAVTVRLGGGQSAKLTRKNHEQQINGTIFCMPLRKWRIFSSIFSGLFHTILSFFVKLKILKILER